jgi:hypothetical protein
MATPPRSGAFQIAVVFSAAWRPPLLEKTKSAHLGGQKRLPDAHFAGLMLG